MHTLRFGLVLLVSCMACSTAAAPRDALQTPALPSALAAQRPLLAVTRAGQRLVAVGRMGHILHSDDQGQSWVQSEVPVTVDLVAVHFATAQRGWATGHDGVVLRSDDGGTSWRKLLDGRTAARQMVKYYRQRTAEGDETAQDALAESQRFLDEDGSRPFLAVWFADAKNGFVIGAWGLILRTQDGGDSWEPWLDRIDNPRHSHLYAMAQTGGQLWIVGEQGLVLRHDGASQRFVAVPTPITGTLFGVIGNRDFTLVHGLLGRAFITRDGGANWAPAGSTGSVGLSSGTLFADGRVLLTDIGGSLWLSRDQGLSFKPLNLEPRSAWYGVTTVNSTRAIAVGTRGARTLIAAP